MNNIKQYKDYKMALNSILKDDKEYIIVNHTLPKDYVVEEHFHPEVDEWLIIDKGRFLLSTDFTVKEYDVCRATAFHFPKTTIHSLKTLGKMSYAVLRSGKDDSIQLSDILKKRNDKESIPDTCGKIQMLYDHKNMTLAYSTIYVGEKSQQHYHKKHDEIYKIMRGEGIIHLGDEYYIQSMFKNDVIEIPRNTLHYIENKGKCELETLVITRSQYDEKDVLRPHL